MTNARIVIEDSLLRQIVASLLDGQVQGDVNCPRVLVVELTGDPVCKGATAVRELRSEHPEIAVVAVSRIDGAVITQQAVRLGVDDYFRLPQEAAEFKNAIAALLSGVQIPEKPSMQQNPLLGVSAQMTSLRKYLARVAMTDSSVLITGETGTGKELVAEVIHKTGARRNKPFVCVNCAAVPESLLESELFGFEKGAFTGAHSRYPGRLRMAHGGTIFFDEIGELSPGAQAKLLRSIESREVFPLGGWRSISIDVRIIAATNLDLDAAVTNRAFRQDLFYRLNVVHIELPPLRSRKEDIPCLIEYFIAVNNRELKIKVERFHPEAVALLQAYNWPGNIRELRNVIEASFVNATSNQIDVLDLPDRLQKNCEKTPMLNTRERLVNSLTATNWNISRAASELRCSRMTIYRKMAEHQISRSQR